MSAVVFLKLNKSFKVKYNWSGVLYPALSMLVIFFDIKNIFLQFILPIIYILFYFVIVNNREKSNKRAF